MLKDKKINYFKKYDSLFKKIKAHEKDNQIVTKIICDFIILTFINSKKSKDLDLFVSLKEIGDKQQLLYMNENFYKKRKYLSKVFIFTQNLVHCSKNIDEFEKILGLVLERYINRKETGSYYTPEDTTKYICWNSIFIKILTCIPDKISSKICKSLNISNYVEFVDKKLSFEEKINIIKHTLTDRDLDVISLSLSKIEIIDPMCGSGAFIVSAYDCIKYLNENLIKNKLKKCYYYKNIHGVDVEKEAVIFAKTRIILKTIIDDNVGRSIKNTLNINIICGDALIESKRDGIKWGKKKYDCIIGNPPYVEIKDKDKYSAYKTMKCTNLYAYSIERACMISKQDSVISFVVPLSLISTTRMKDVKQHLENKSKIVYYSTFADRPGCLFTGVHQRLTIFFSQIGNEECKVYTSSYNYWYKDERKKLFTNISFIENKYNNTPKIGLSIENSIFAKNSICSDSVNSLCDKKGKFPLYISTRIGLWAKAFLFKPKTKEIAKITFNSEELKRIVYCFVNSSLFYFLWIINSDCWHVTNTDLMNIKFNFNMLTQRQKDQLVYLSEELERDLEHNKERINTKQSLYEYKHKYSKKIIDKIDDIICPSIGLNQDETKYVKNYALKYRMNNAVNTIED